MWAGHRIRDEGGRTYADMIGEQALALEHAADRADALNDRNQELAEEHKALLDALAAMVDLGADAQQIRASLGPAICGQCYPVPPERAQEAAEAWPDSRATAPDGQPGIDVRAGLRQRLRAAGVLVEYIGGCTAEDPELFSYRRDGLTGRQGVAVWWTRS